MTPVLAVMTWKRRNDMVFLWVDVALAVMTWFSRE